MAARLLQDLLIPCALIDNSSENPSSQACQKPTDWWIWYQGAATRSEYPILPRYGFTRSTSASAATSWLDPKSFLISQRPASFHLEIGRDRSQGDGKRAGSRKPLNIENTQFYVPEEEEQGEEGDLGDWTVTVVADCDDAVTHVKGANQAPITFNICKEENWGAQSEKYCCHLR